MTATARPLKSHAYDLCSSSVGGRTERPAEQDTCGRGWRKAADRRSARPPEGGHHVHRGGNADLKVGLYHLPMSYSPMSWMTISRLRGCVSNSTSTICCHVPSADAWL